MSIIECIFHPVAVVIYYPGVIVGLLASFREKTKKGFMKLIALTVIWPFTIIGYIFVEFYNWYTNLNDE